MLSFCITLFISFAFISSVTSHSKYLCIDLAIRLHCGSKKATLNWAGACRRCPASHAHTFDFFVLAQRDQVLPCYCFFQVLRPEPSKSNSTSRCSRKFPIFPSWWRRKWTSPAIILVGLKCHHEKHLENPAKVKPGAASTWTFPVGECATCATPAWTALDTTQ